MTQYTLIKIPLKELIEQDFCVSIDREEEICREYLVAQPPSLLFDQLERLRGKSSMHISEVILVVAQKSIRQKGDLKRVLADGFWYNGVHYNRFGKSASQAKDGITAFVCDAFFDELYAITQMDIAIDECVISKYEAQRCLAFSSCTLIKGYMPNIVIIGEFQKTLKDQYIKYVTEKEKSFIDPETGEKISYRAKEIEEGVHDLTISPFDGCGCHERDFMEEAGRQMGLSYDAAGFQIRLPFIKGYSVYVPFRKILKEWGVSHITDIYGKRHPVEEIDCIWNVSMFKGHKLFFEKYGNQAWVQYQKTLRKYQFKLGISKFSHHIKSLNKYTRMNFQYLQCLDLWNPNYIACYEKKDLKNYDILDENNDGKIIRLAKYTTGLYEKIIRGDKFYTYKFMGISDTETYEPKSVYLKALLMDDEMRNDPAVRQFLYRKLKKAIDEAKVGKIYCSGFYHTGVGDMIGYLQYAAGEEPTGCLKKGEVYSGNFGCGPLLSFRSPLVDPSEVNRIQNAQSDVIQRWFSHFKDQDVVMFNMHDISAPQQGGADFDGDIFFLCDDPFVIDAKIEKPVILDVHDKATAKSKPYTKENLIEYECMTRDSRIGEITNAATSVENRYTTNQTIRKKYDDYASLLRIFQGKEIDFLKTGFRWQMNRGLKKYVKQIPYFLLYNYPAKMETYKKNAYYSPSPMNELCDYICTWEKKRFLWKNDDADFGVLQKRVLNQTLDVSNPAYLRAARRAVNTYANELRAHMKQNPQSFQMEEIKRRFQKELAKQIPLSEELIANYVIKASYNTRSISKSLAWTGYGDYILKNLKANASGSKKISIRESSCEENGALEYLGKYYTYREVDEP